MATYDFPPDLRDEQAELRRIQAEHRALMRELPRSVEDPEHWYRRNHPLPASSGYTPEQREQAVEQQARLLEATVRVSTHPFWSSLSGENLVAARMELKNVEAAGAEPAVFGPVASDPTVSRLIGTLAAAGDKALTAIRSARAEVREYVWTLATDAAPDAGRQVIVDLDGVLVLAHSDKQDAAATWKKSFGHHPLMGFVDHGSGGTGEPVAALLRPGNAGSNTAADHITATQLALAQLPKRHRRGRSILIRTDSAGGTHEFLAWLPKRGRWLSYSVGMTITEQIHQAVLKVPTSAWSPAAEPGGEIRDGAWTAELDGDVLKGWPKGIRLIVRKERPHPGAQLRFTDADGLRLTCFATNTTGGKITDLELRHRRRARPEDRIRNARATGRRNLPLHETAQNRIWLEIVQLALDLLAWMPMLAMTGKPRLWEPRRLPLRLFSAAAQIIITARRRHLRFAGHWPWTDVITDAIRRLDTLPNPG